MNQNKFKIFLFFLVGALAGMFAMYLLSHYKIEKKQQEATYTAPKNKNLNKNSESKNSYQSEGGSALSSEIDKLTGEEVVIDYVKKNGKLPGYYITKSEARNRGWVPSKGNLCEVLPGRAIGGDKFSNREKKLPRGGKYYEADVNYNCGNRNADRIIFTKNGDVWLTHDHYKSFMKQ